MTAPQPADESQEQVVEEWVIVEPPADTRFEQLAAEYDDVKDRLDQLQERLDVIAAGLKLEAATAVPGKNKIRVKSKFLRIPLSITFNEGQWRLNKKFKEEQTETWARYSYQTKPFWKLERMR